MKYQVSFNKILQFLNLHILTQLHWRAEVFNSRLVVFQS